MAKINQHIEKLLAYHDYVVVPGLGGFVVQHQSAKITAGHISAPTATVGFNSLMQHADGLLAIEVARAELPTGRQLKLLSLVIQKSIAKINTPPAGKSGVLFAQRKRKPSFCSLHK